MDIVRLRYIGVDRVRVPKLGRVVEPDELVGVPADVFGLYGWPESHWKVEDGEQAPPPGGGQAPLTPSGGEITTTTSRKGNKDA